MLHTVPPLPERIDTHTRRREEQPNNPDAHPARKERFTEHIPSPIQRHGPQNQQNKRHNDREGFRDKGCTGEFGLFFGGFFGGEAGDVVGDGFDVDVLRGGDGDVVAEADERHGFVVVVLGAEGVGEDGDEDEGGEEGGDVASEHGVAGRGLVWGRERYFESYRGWFGGEEGGD